MLPKDPPPWMARAIAWLLIAMAGTALLASLVVRVPETVVCRFVLVPEGRRRSHSVAEPRRHQRRAGHGGRGDRRWATSCSCCDPMKS